MIYEKHKTRKLVTLKIFHLRLIVLISIFLFVSNPDLSLAWHDETHLAVAKAAGYDKWYNSAGAYIAKIKAGRVEKNNHYFGNPKNVEVTLELVLKQVKKYNDPIDIYGHVYGAIIASLRDYKSTTRAGKYAEYHVAYCAHYVADLSQPLHNVPYNSFNKAHHKANDGIVESEVLENIAKIQENMYNIILSADNFEEDLSKEIARIADLSRELGHKLKKENRDMTKTETYIQLGHSASLLKSILKYLGKIK